LKIQKGGGKVTKSGEKGSAEMGGPRAKPVTVSSKEAQVLSQIIRQPSQPQWLVTRSKIILGAAAGESISQQSRELGLVRKAVQHWRDKWERHQAERQVGEETGDLAVVISQVLHDAYRSGSPATFSAEQIVQIVAVACEEPQASGYPISHWTPKDVAQEVVKRGIVSRISPRQVGRFLKRSGRKAAFEPVLAQHDGERRRDLSTAVGIGVRRLCWGHERP
jgi:putative transposase